MTSNPYVSQALLEKGQFITFLDRVEPLVDPQVPETVLITAFRSSTTIGVMLKTNGFEELMAITRRISDPSQRGTLLGRIMSDRAVMMYLRNRNNLLRIVELARNEDDQSIRQAYIKAILQSNYLAALDESESSELFLAIWKLVENASDKSVQEQALGRLMHIPAFVRLIREKDGAMALFNMLGQLDRRLLELMISRMTYNEEAIAMLSEPRLLAEMLILVGRLDPWKTRASSDEILLQRCNIPRFDDTTPQCSSAGCCAANSSRRINVIIFSLC